MKHLFAIGIAILFFTLPVEGLLPPLYQGIKELQTLLASPELGHKLDSGDILEKIEKTEYGYKITTSKRELHVHVIYNNNGKIGPATFTLKFEEAVELPQPI